MTKLDRTAKAFAPDHPSLTRTPDPAPMEELEAQLHNTNDKSNTAKSSKRFKLASLFVYALLSLLGVYTALWFANIGHYLLASDGVIKWIALGLLALLSLLLVIFLLRDLWSIAKLKRLQQMREQAMQAMNKQDGKTAKKLLRQWQKSYGHKPHASWAVARTRDYKDQLFDAKETIVLADREIGKALDDAASKIIVDSSKKVSVATAFIPFPLIDMISVGVLNIAMLRQIAQIYGGRPGMFGILKMGRMIFTHLLLTGGLSLAGDFLKPLIGKSLVGKLSKKMGEGLFNGALTARIGLAAIDVVRPIPYVETKPLKLSSLIRKALLTQTGQNPPTPAQKND